MRRRRQHRRVIRAVLPLTRENTLAFDGGAQHAEPYSSGSRGVVLEFGRARTMTREYIGMRVVEHVACHALVGDGLQRGAAVERRAVRQWERRRRWQRCCHERGTQEEIINRKRACTSPRRRSACRLQDDLPAPTNFYSGVMVSSFDRKKLMS